jgi:hypothetical protein
MGVILLGVLRQGRPVPVLASYGSTTFSDAPTRPERPICCGRYAVAARRRPGAGRWVWSIVIPRRLSELDKGERRLAWLRTAAVLAVAWAALIAVYYLVPAGVVPGRHHSGADTFVHLGIAVTLFAAVLAGQARRIMTAELPELRAVEALGVVLAADGCDRRHRGGTDDPRHLGADSVAAHHADPARVTVPQRPPAATRAVGAGWLARLRVPSKRRPSGQAIVRAERTPNRNFCSPSPQVGRLLTATPESAGRM